MAHYTQNPTPAERSTALANNIEALTATLLGPPTAHTRHEWRWRSKGSLAVVMQGDKRGRFYDHETGVGGDAIDLVRLVNGGSMRDALQWAADWLNLPADTRTRPSPVDNNAEQSTGQVARIDRALAIWGETLDLIGSVAETYLRHRRIPPPDGISDLRFHPRCPVGNGERLPAMVALFRDVTTNKPRGIHRTFLKADGTGKADAGKKMLGITRGAVIKLSSDDSVTTGLGICEGIETGLSLWLYGIQPLWIAGSAGSIRTFPTLDGIEALTIYADGDAAGIEAARTCAGRWCSAGRAATIHTAPAGADWNDIVRSIAA
jgi:putative DNA primase/helicase